MDIFTWKYQVPIWNHNQNSGSYNIQENVELSNIHPRRVICMRRRKNFYLCTPLNRNEYTRIPIKLIPQEFIDLYDLTPKVKNGYVYMEISRGMYGLPQSGILANKLLKNTSQNKGTVSYHTLPDFSAMKHNKSGLC